MHAIPTLRPLYRLLPAFLAVASVLSARTPAADMPPELAKSGLAVVPADAAFLSATLRGREQYDRFVKSNAYAALRGVPALKRAIDSFEEQRSMPGNPLSMADAFLQLPENAQAAELLADMVATETFVYGEPSCAAFVQLVRKLAAVTQTVGAMSEPDVMIEEEMEIFEDDDGGEAASRRAARTMRCQAGLAERSPEAVRQRLMIQTLVDNLDLLVVPDVVWGFKTTKAAIATAQIARLEVLARGAVEGHPDLADAINRHQVAGGDFLVFTARGASLPWDEIERDFEEHAGDIDGFADVFARLRKLDLCVAIGVVGDRVILSVGDSTDHLAKLGGAAGKGLLGLPALAPVLAHADKPLTGVSYMSAAMVKALSQSPEDLRQQFDVLDESLEDSGLPEEAMDEGRKLVEEFTAAIAKRMPEPGPWNAVSFLTDSGYEGYSWDWSRNQPLDGTRRLDVLEHAGGAPLAVAASRLKADPRIVEEVSSLVEGLWSLFFEHAVPALDDEVQDRAEEFNEHMGPIARRLADALRGKLLPALADGQIGLVLDGKSRNVCSATATRRHFTTSSTTSTDFNASRACSFSSAAASSAFASTTPSRSRTQP